VKRKAFSLKNASLREKAMRTFDNTARFQLLLMDEVCCFQIVEECTMAMEKMTNIYTDGACSGNQHDKNLGGWGAVLEYGRHQREIFGSERDTTNNRMEMKALIEALERLNRDGLHINIFSDSAYLMDCFRKKWYVKWQANGWLTSKREPVENRDLWETLLPWLSRHDLRFYRVKGHASTEDGEAKLRPLYEKFKAWNGASFTYENFLHVTEMNNLADALANKGIDALRE
jgi:ribonuclease HI